MARSPSHEFGQLVGSFIEKTFLTVLESFAVSRSLYLDTKGKREARGSSTKVKWKDYLGNTHELDFVIEQGGTNDTIGVPIAFIESAWRRYTKHSKNKAQEIQGALLPLFETYKKYCPFLGVLLIGEFTGPSIQQLKSSRFEVLYIPTRTLLDVFNEISFDLSWEESTPIEVLNAKITAWNALSKEDLAERGNRLLEVCHSEVQIFMSALERSMNRVITKVIIMPLYGQVIEHASLEMAIESIEQISGDGTYPLFRVSIDIIYSNGDKISGDFGEKRDAALFLRNYLG